MFTSTNSYSIVKFTFNYNLWHYVEKVLNFVVNEIMYEGESSTSRLIFWLGISGLMALGLYSYVIYDIMELMFVPFLFWNKLSNSVHFLRTRPLESCEKSPLVGVDEERRLCGSKWSETDEHRWRSVDEHMTYMDEPWWTASNERCHGRGMLGKGGWMKSHNATVTQMNNMRGELHSSIGKVKTQWDIKTKLPKLMKGLFWMHFNQCWLWNLHGQFSRLKWGLSIGSWNMKDELLKNGIKWDWTINWIYNNK